MIFHNPQTNERSLKKLLLELLLGSSGAVSITRGINITSAAKTGTGEITITLPKFQRFVGAQVLLLSSTARDFSYQIKSVNAQTGTIIVMTKIAGSAADLSSGDKLLIELKYKNTVVAN